MLTLVKRVKQNLSLSQRFMLASLFILLAGMVGIGAWVQKQIELGVIHRTGAATAIFVDSFVAPNLQELGQANELSPEHIENLSNLLQNSPMGNQIVAFKVWDVRGRLLYSTDPLITGQTFPMHEGLLNARLGKVVSEISLLEKDENAPLANRYDKLLETYSPVWLSGTNQVIAVAEFYQLTDELDKEIGVLKRRSWLVVGLAIFSMYLLLSGFVRRASDTILLQQSELNQKVIQLIELLAQNRELHERVRRASASVAMLNESYLRRIGSELHDGPAQDLGLSILKVGAVASQIEKTPPARDSQATLDQLSGIEISLQNALKEIRGIAAGLSLPQLNELSLPETVSRVVRAHEHRSGMQVDLVLENIPEQTSPVIKITTYRLVQEALNNSFRHAIGAPPKVQLSCEKNQLVVRISDMGPGFDPKQASNLDGHLGISGMRERVESLGGEFFIDSELGQGTTVLAYLPLQIDGGAAG